MAAVDDARLSMLLDHQQAGTLTSEERAELAALMQLYQVGLLRKAQALREAVRRGLRCAFSRARRPGTPRRRAAGQPIAPASGRTTNGARLATPTKLSFPPAPSSTSFAAARASGQPVQAAPLYATASALAASRVYLGLHSPTDVAAGALPRPGTGSGAR